MADLSDPSAGLNPAVPSDLDAIYQGGQNFLARMQAMASQRDSAAQALAQLNLGNDIAGAQKAAQAALLDAENKQSAADKALADAKAQASSIIADAQTQAQAITDGANTAAAKVTATAATVRQDADDYTAQAKAQADAIIASANAQATAIQDKSTMLDKALIEANTAKEVADKAIFAANASKHDYDDRMNRISAILAQPVTTT